MENSIRKCVLEQFLQDRKRATSLVIPSFTAVDLMLILKNLNHKEISNQKNYQHSMARYTSGRDQHFELSQDLSQWNITLCPGVHTK